jgi:hypothetical protein
MPILGINMSKFIPLVVYPLNRSRGVIYKIYFQPDLTTPPPNKEIISEKLLYKEGVYLCLFSTKKNGIILKNSDSEPRGKSASEIGLGSI